MGADKAEGARVNPRRINKRIIQAQREYEQTEHKPDDVFRLFVAISKGEFGNVVIEDIVTKLIEYNNGKLDKLQTEFDAL